VKAFSLKSMSLEPSGAMAISGLSVQLLDEFPEVPVRTHGLSLIKVLGVNHEI